MADGSFSYIAKCPKYKQVFGAAIDDPRFPKRTAKHVREFIADGGIVERVPSDEVKRVFGCDRGLTCNECDGFEIADDLQGRLL